MRSSELKTLLTGGFEPAQDQAFVKDFAYNPLNLEGDLLRPVIDEYLLDQGIGRPTWPENKRFAVCLTHDVDEVSQYHLGQNLRYLLRKVPVVNAAEKKMLRQQRRNTLPAILKSVGSGPDPFEQIHRWVELEQKYNATATWFFPPTRIGMRHPSDCKFSYSQRCSYQGKSLKVSELIRLLKREENEIGLHPSWRAAGTVDEMLAQKHQLDELLSEPIVSVRNHFLRYLPGESHEIQARAGFSFDSTLGYNDAVGFRRGTSYPFPVSDIGDGLLEIPMIMQDSALLLDSKGMRLDVDTAMRYYDLLVQRIENTGGVLTLSWHPHMISVPGYFELYTQMLADIVKRDVWFTTIEGLGNWWLQKQSRDLLNIPDLLP